MRSLELLQLQADAFDKLDKFLKRYNKHIDEQASADFDAFAAAKAMESTTPEGIAFREAVRKVEQYKIQNNIQD